MMEKIVHTAKQTVKAMVESHSARAWSPLWTAARSFMDCSPSHLADEMPGGAK
jgi:hypothetical protein